MTKLPYMKFFPADWLGDPALRAVSPAAKGLWIDMLCLLWESVPRGYLQHATGKPVSNEQLGRMVGCSEEVGSRLLAELEDSGVFSRTPQGVIYSRRIVRDEQMRQACSQAGKKGGGNPALKPATASAGGPKGLANGPPKGAYKGTYKGAAKGPSDICPLTSSLGSDQVLHQQQQEPAQGPAPIPVAAAAAVENKTTPGDSPEPMFQPAVRDELDRIGIVGAKKSALMLAWMPIPGAAGKIRAIAEAARDRGKGNGAIIGDLEGAAMAERIRLREQNPPARVRSAKVQSATDERRRAIQEWLDAIQDPGLRLKKAAANLRRDGELAAAMIWGRADWKENDDVGSGEHSVQRGQGSKQ